jgi:hypothetical protein
MNKSVLVREETQGSYNPRLSLILGTRTEISQRAELELEARTLDV